MTHGVPPAEIAIDEPLARRLLGAQHPDLARLALKRLAEGWDTVIFRLGDDLTLRMPRREVVAACLLNEQRWLPELAPLLPVPVPAPLRVGRPGEGYPWPWTVARFLPGAPLDEAPLGQEGADDMGRFLKALHQPSPPEAPANPFRGGPLRERAPSFEARAERLGQRGALPAHVRAIWRAALEAPIDAGAVWLHGDLHPLNVLGLDGRIAGVIDWIDICAGDPATDLAALWLLLGDERARTHVLEAYGGASPATLARARGWAAHHGVMTLSAGLVDSPRHAAMGAATLSRLEEAGA